MPDGSEAIVIGEEGYPHGYEHVSQTKNEIATHRSPPLDEGSYRLWVYVLSEWVVSVVWKQW